MCVCVLDTWVHVCAEDRDGHVSLQPCCPRYLCPTYPSHHVSGHIGHKWRLLQEPGTQAEEGERGKQRGTQES